MTTWSGWAEQAERTLALWPLWIILVVGVGLLLLFVMGPRFTRGTRGVTHAFYCPLREQSVRVGFQVAAWDGRLVDVDQCSAFTPRTAVSCAKACLKPEEFGRVRVGSAA